MAQVICTPPQIDLKLSNDSVLPADWIVSWGDASRHENDTVYRKFKHQLDELYQLQNKSTDEYSKLFRLQ